MTPSLVPWGMPPLGDFHSVDKKHLDPVDYCGIHTQA